MILKGSGLSLKSFWANGDVFREADPPVGCLTCSTTSHAMLPKSPTRTFHIMSETSVSRVAPTLAISLFSPPANILSLCYSNWVAKHQPVDLDDANLEKRTMCCTLGSFLHGSIVLHQP